MTNRRPRPLERLRYRFDSSLARGPWVLIGWLGLATLLFLLLAAAVIATFGLGIAEGESANFVESFWQALTRVFDSGTFSGDNGWALRLVTLVITLGGVFLVTALIGLIASSIDQRIADLGKGRSPVLETGHVLVLGWSARLFSVLSELIEANANHPGRARRRRHRPPHGRCHRGRRPGAGRVARLELRAPDRALPRRRG